MAEHRRLPIADCRFRSVIAACVAIALAAAQTIPAGEAIYLNSGEEYRGTLERIAGGKVVARIAGEERSFDLANIQRIEFQRRRRFDDVAKAADLPDLPVFRAIAPKTADLRRRFPQAGHVVLYDSTRVRLMAKGRYAVDRVRAWRILHERAANSAKRSLVYLRGRQAVEILYGLTVAPDGAVTRLSDSAMKDEALYATQPAYDYQRRLRFSLRGPVPGATLVEATRLTGTATLLVPLVLDETLHGTEPALYREVRLVRDAATVGQPSVAALNGLTEAKDGVWSVRNTPQIFPEPLMPPLAAFSPRLVIAWPKATWADIARAFARRAGGDARLRRDGSPAQLFDFVRTQVRIEDVPLDALPEGPAKPSAVLQRGYGTEIERALLLAALLRGAGCQAETALVCERNGGPLVERVPHLNAFSRAVVKMTDPKGVVTWLQADHADRGFGELDPAVQHAHGISLTTGQLLTVPAADADSERRSLDVELAPDGSAKVTDVTLLRGSYAHACRNLRQLTEAQLAKWAIRFVGRQRTGVHLLSFEHSDFAKANAEERLTLVYRVPALADAAGDFIVLRLPNAEESASDVGRSERQYDLFWQGTEHEELEAVVRAPAGYKVYAIGEGVAAKGDGWSVAAGFEADPAEAGVVRFRGVWQRTALTAPKTAYPAYRTACIRRSLLRNEVIVFVKE